MQNQIDQTTLTVKQIMFFDMWQAEDGPGYRGKICLNNIYKRPMYLLEISLVSFIISLF